MEREPTADGAPPRAPEVPPAGTEETPPGAADGATSATAAAEEGQAADVQGGGTGQTRPERSTSGRGSASRRTWSRPAAALATAALAVALGFALTVQIRSTTEPDERVGQREEDLILILDTLNTREETLRRQIAETRQTVEELSSGQEQSGGALEEARSRAEAIGILAGTLPARGPGLRMTIQDPDGAVPASVILGAIQELRGAGAEAIQVDDVRVVVSSAVTGTPGALRIDGQPLSAPYEFRVIGPSPALDVALKVSGGIVADVSRVGGRARVEQADDVTVDATVD